MLVEVSHMDCHLLKRVQSLLFIRSPQQWRSGRRLSGRLRRFLACMYCWECWTLALSGTCLLRMLAAKFVAEKVKIVPLTLCGCDLRFDQVVTSKSSLTETVNPLPRLDL